MLRICFPMDKHIKKIYYITMAESEEGRERKRNAPLAVYQCGCRPPFMESSAALRRKCAADSELQLYFSLLPGSFIKDMEKPRKKKKWMQKLMTAITFIRESMDCKPEDIIFSDRLFPVSGGKCELPEELFAAYLYDSRERYSFKHMNITLPADCGLLTAESVIRLLNPYLSQINTVTFAGEETESTWMVEDYLYEEYGITAAYKRRPEKDTVWLDFDNKETEYLISYAFENGIYRISRSEVLKFLDTTVKSGYNTKVN